MRTAQQQQQQLVQGSTQHSTATTFLPTPAAGAERSIREYTVTAGTFDMTLSAGAASGQVGQRPCSLSAC